MFDFFKRWLSPAPAAPPPRRPTRRTTTSTKKSAIAAPAPLPEVVEGSDESDWALWEDSKAAFDSRILGLSRASGYGKLDTGFADTQPSELGSVSDSLYGDIDPFGTVRKRDL